MAIQRPNGDFAYGTDVADAVTAQLQQAIAEDNALLSGSTDNFQQEVLLARIEEARSTLANHLESVG